MNTFDSNNTRLLQLIEVWKPRLQTLPADVITNRRNGQNRNIKQIVGHMVDSASNNTHRIIHLQYQASPLIYPDYANLAITTAGLPFKTIRTKTGTIWCTSGSIRTFTSFMLSIMSTQPNLTTFGCRPLGKKFRSAK
jgi:hypothetical protein